ncbi:MAG: hemerythrin [Moraxellaceae bacterium]|jgi:hemerythrin-like domain-containing protein|nr:hemerythrin [Moraxellaceae bacterium]
MNIYDVLRHEHYVIKAYLKKISDMGARKPATRRRDFLQLQALLAAHSAAEEEIFYLPLRHYEEAEALSRQGRIQHDLAGSLMEVIAGLEPTDRDWTAYFAVFRAAVEAHIHQEEKEFFKLARRILDAETELRMGEEMRLVGKGMEAMPMVEIQEPPALPGSQSLH